LAVTSKKAVLVLDFGSQYNQLIVRRVRELGVYAELVAPDEAERAAERLNVQGYILSGGPSSVFDEGAPSLPQSVISSEIPVLGICYGMQLLAHLLGGKVRRGEKGEYGSAHISIQKGYSLTDGLPEESSCWMSHGDNVLEMPPGFVHLASTAAVPYAAMASGSIYGVQFHPEVSHTPFGKKLLRNFLSICGCDFLWSPDDLVEESIAMIRERVGDSSAICAVSGGVDSTVAAVIAGRAIGERLHCVFVDNGLLRHQEAKKVAEALTSVLKGSFSVVDASSRFISALAGVTDPEEKRKRIGETFIRVFEEKAGTIDGLKYLIQGTLYPDVIESRGRGAHSARIKTHHNVGGLPENMELTVLEPLRYLFKDEVRRVGKELGVPSYLLERQPFPGPGLAVRIIGEVTEERLGILRQADLITVEEIEKSGRKGLWQFFPVYVPLNTVGVMGDQRTYCHLIALRIVTSEDGMTCDWARLPWDLLDLISRRIVNEVKGINRVVYDITSKPPATIEWE